MHSHRAGATAVNGWQELGAVRPVTAVSVAVADSSAFPAPHIVVAAEPFPILPDAVNGFVDAVAVRSRQAASRQPDSGVKLGVTMRFTLLDRVVAIEPGKSITAIKTLSLSEEYLADHFPCFPVMPGVLMLESMTQAAAWAIRLGEDFAHSIVVLREARNVKYGDFVEPGRVLTVTAEVQSQEGQLTKVKASGSVGDRTSLTARLVLERYNLADRIPYGDAVDARVRAEMRKLWAILHPGGRQQAANRRVVYGGPTAGMVTVDPAGSPPLVAASGLPS
jgi:3-hydroxyacyl-[acyl-carrier-protein] dehydratase